MRRESSSRKDFSRAVIAFGIIIAIIGVALMIISPSLLFTETVPDFIPGRGQTTQHTNDLRNIALLSGIALLIVGGIISAIGYSLFTSTQPTQLAPTVTYTDSPKRVELGNTPDEVQSSLGQPDKIINLGARVTHVYKDMKVIYVDGKVSDVQLS